MANYKLYITTYIGHSVNDTIPSAVGKLNYVRIDTDTGSMFISDGTNWNAVGGSSNLDALTDVDLTTDTPDNNDVLTYSTTGSKWVPAPPPGAGGGEANTVTNVGTGAQVAKAKVGVDIPVRTFVAGTGGKVTVTQNTNEIEIQAVDASTTQKGAVELATSAETTAGLAVQASDTRLSDARTPTTHTHAPADVTGTAATLAGSESLSNKTIPSPTITGTVTLDSTAANYVELVKAFTNASAESILKIRLTEDTNSYIDVFNGTSTNGVFSPVIRMKQNTVSTVPGGFLIGEIHSSFDTGTVPALSLTGRLHTGAALGTRPIVDIVSGSTTEYSFSGTQADFKGNTLANAVIASTVTGIVDANISAHTSTKITITDKTKLNTAIMYEDEDNNVGDHYMDFGDMPVPANPAAGVIRLFNNSATGELSVRKSGGTTVSLESGGGGGGDATLAGTNTWTGVNTFDLRTQLKSLAATPSDPTAGYTEIYGKVKDANNDGIFAKYKIGGAITEVELGVADDVLSLTELSDVTTTSPADKHFLIHNGTQWINRLIAASDLPSSVPLLNTANVFTAIQKINVDNGQQMTFYRPVNTAGFGAGFYYNFNDSASAEQTYGFQYVSIESNTAGAVRGDFNIQLAVAGSLGIRFRAFTSGNGGIIFGNNQRALLSETGLTAQRTITLPDSDQTLLGRTDTATITNKTIQGLKTNVNSKTATYTAALTDDYIPCAPAANMTINLPAASTAAGKRLKIQKTDNSAFTVTIDANSTETINGAETYVLNAQYQVVELECDGSAWYTTGYSISREGTAQGNGNATTYNIPHGLGVVPSYFHAICTAPSGVSAYTQSADATNITVVFSSSTPAGTNNVKFSWRAVI